MRKSETSQLTTLPKKIRKDEPVEGFFGELQLEELVSSKNLHAFYNTINRAYNKRCPDQGAGGGIGRY